jgi:hypothetical protein
MALNESPRDKEVIDLAIEEGHDADIPTNEGAVAVKPPSQARHTTPIEGKDVEKHDASKASSIQSLDEERIIGDQSKEPSNIVGWDGDDDPANPMNWSSFRK